VDEDGDIPTPTLKDSDGMRASLTPSPKPGLRECLKRLARPGGLEPPTLGLEGRCSIPCYYGEEYAGETISNICFNADAAVRNGVHLEVRVSACRLATFR
jgi:hypothetical protein